MKTETRMLFEQAIREMPKNIDEDYTTESYKIQSSKRIVATRALNGLASLVELFSPEEVAIAPTDIEVLLRLLEMPEAIEVLSKTDPLAGAKVRGLRVKEQLLKAEGGVISTQEAADLLHLSRQAIDKRRKKGQLIGLSMGRRGYVYPVWQFVEEGTLSGLELVLAELRDHDAWMQTAFMVNSNTLLNGETPLALLRRGEVEAVRQAAREYCEQGAA